MDSRHVFSEKSFEAFTTSSEAFALQKSVISNPLTVPASPDVVAQVVAQYRQSKTHSMADSASNGDGFSFNGHPPTSFGSTSGGDARREPIRYPAVVVTTVKEKGGIYAKPKDRQTSSSRTDTASPSKTLLVTSDAAKSSGVKPIHISKGGRQSEAVLHTSFTETPPRELDSSVFNAEYNVSLDRPLSRAVSVTAPSDVPSVIAHDGTSAFHPAGHASSPTAAAATPPPLVVVSSSGTPLHSSASGSNTALETKSRSNDSETYERFLYEKANLEGRLETLVEEAEAGMRERAHLQAELAAAHSQLAQQRHLVTVTHVNDKMAAADGERQLQQLRLEARVTELQAAADGAALEARRLADELRAAHAGGERLREAAGIALADVAARERLIGELRVALDIARGDGGRAGDERRRAEDETRRILEDLSALAATRDWYQQQLHAAQEMRAQLQTELTKMQNLTASQTDSLERLRVENTQMKHQLTETQHKALTEKQLLVRHLETIEADMLEREAGIDQIQREQNITELTAQQRLIQAEKERMQLGKLMAAASELERELQRSEHELEAARAEAEVVDAQRAELGRRLVATQETLALRDRELERLHEAGVQTEARLKSFMKKDSEKDTLMLQLKEEKSSVEVALHSALEEKKAFSAAVEALKANTAKVEANFKLMRQELTAKNRELELAAESKSKLQQELAAAQTVSAQSALALGSVNPEVLQGEREKLVSVAVEEHRLANHRLMAELDGLRHDLVLAQQREQQAVNDRLAFEHHYAAARNQALQLEHAAQKASAAKAELEGQLHEAREQLDAAVRQRLAENYDIIKKTCEEQKEKVTVLTNDLESARHTLRDRQAEYHSTVALLNQQLKEAIGSRDRAFKELMSSTDDDRTRATASEEQQEHMLAQLKLLQADLTEAQRRKSELEWLLTEQQTATRGIVEEFRLKVAALERSLVEAREHIDQQRHLTESCRLLQLELEKERGRLAGVRQHHDKLKQHARELEAALARRESSVVELSASSLQTIRRQDELLEEQRCKLREHDEAAQLERAALAELHAQLGHELDSSSKHKQLAEVARSELVQLRHEVERKALEILSLTAELERTKAVEERQTASLHMLHSEYRNAKVEAEQLRRAVAESAAKAPIINDEIKALHWQIKQKTKEASDLDNLVRLTESRLQLETDNMKKALTASNMDIESFRLELAGTRKEKFSYQAKVSELRGALKTVLQHVKSDKSENHLDVEPFEKIVEDAAVPSYKSKPLENLKSCLAGLQTEMQVLQQQMIAPKEPHASATTTDAAPHFSAAAPPIR